MTIYLIEDNIERDGYNGSYIDVVIDPDVGYFTSLEEALAYIDSIVKPARAKYDAAVKVYDRKVKQYNARRAELKAQGARPAEDYPTHPRNAFSGVPVVPILTVAEVEPAKEEP